MFALKRGKEVTCGEVKTLETAEYREINVMWEGFTSSSCSALSIQLFVLPIFICQQGGMAVSAFPLQVYLLIVYSHFLQFTGTQTAFSLLQISKTYFGLPVHGVHSLLVAFGYKRSCLQYIIYLSLELSTKWNLMEWVQDCMLFVVLC